MEHETAFLRAILEDPRDDAPRLLYADWLEERGGPASEAKVEFLRLTAQLTAPGAPKGRRKSVRKRLQELAAGLDTDWLAVVSRLAVENCSGKRAQAESAPMRPFRFDYLCDRRWEDMRPTDAREVRFCVGCGENVHYCDTIIEARRHAQARHCVAVDLGVIRRERDLQPMMMFLGRPSAKTLRKERERAEPDPVSAEREQRKREQVKREGS